MDISLIIPSFIAGLLMFLAPCTLPLLPGYLAFISGADEKDIEKARKNEKAMKSLRKKVFMNGVAYVLGFSVVFVLFGVLIGLVGAHIVGEYRGLLTRIGGVLVIIFGLFMLDLISVEPLRSEKKVNINAMFEKGKPSTSFMLGSAFAVGWTPCIGPLLSSILLLAATSTTAIQGGILLAVFSLGMGIPFLIIAWSIGTAYEKVQTINRFMPIISKIGGVFLIILGILLFTNQLGLLIAYGYEWFDFLNYDSMLEFY